MAKRKVDADTLAAMGNRERPAYMGPSATRTITISYQRNERRIEEK